MSARAITSATVSFGLVSIPVKLYSASESSGQISFNMVHAECGTRVKQQLYCPTHDRTVDRSETSRGYEFAKGQFVLIGDEEYKALQEVASNAIELTEFVPAAEVDPIYFEKSYYLGPDKGGERAYKLLTVAMAESGLYGVAKYAARGKQYLVVVRPHKDEGLILHQLHYADEIKAWDEVPIKDAPAPAARELALARQIIEQIASETFSPGEYHDEVRERMQTLIDQKVEGQDITAAPEAEPEAEVIDLMEALKQSLGMTPGGKRAPARKADGGEARADGGKGKAKAGAKAAKADDDDKPARRAAGGRGKR